MFQRPRPGTGNAMIDLIEVQDLAGKKLGRIDLGSWDISCTACRPATELDPPAQMGTAEGLGTAVTTLVEHLAVVHGELSHPDDDDDGGAEGAALWGAAHDRLRRSDPAP